MGALLSATQSSAAAPGTQLVSVGLGGEAANGQSFEPVVSTNAVVAWSSTASNLAPGDGNGFADVFARRLPSGAAQLVSALPGGTTGPGPSTEPDLTANGRYVAFTAVPDGLVSEDANGAPDVYVRDLATGSIELVSVSTAGEQGNSFSHQPTISDDGRLVAFTSAATNLAAGGNGVNEFGLYVRDLRRGTTTRVTTADSSFFGELSGNGEAIAFQTEVPLAPGDTNNMVDVYVADLRRAETERVSGGAGSLNGFVPAIDAKGDHVAFTAGTTDVDPSGIPITHVFVWERSSRSTEVVDVSDAEVRANQFSFGASIDRSGRRVAFASFADNLVAADANGSPDVFVRDMRRGTTERASVGDAGQEANSFSDSAAISPNGHLVAFSSNASNLVPGDANGEVDVFLRRVGGAG